MKGIFKWAITAIVLAVVVECIVLISMRDKLSNRKENAKPRAIVTEGLVGNGENGGKTEKSAEVYAPDFTLLDYNGNEIKFSDFKGKPVVLNFWASWCYYCKVEMPYFDRASGKYKDIQFVMLNVTDGKSETVESAKSYIEGEGYTFDVFFDTSLEAVEKYNIQGYPTTYFIDAEGRVAAYKVGMLTEEELEGGIELIAGKG